MFETEAFEVHAVVSHGGIVMAHGYLRHRVKTTQNQFACEWALICEVKDHQISSYKVFEDTAALAAAHPVDAPSR